MPRGQRRKVARAVRRQLGARRIQAAFRGYRQRRRTGVKKNRDVIPRPLKCFPNSMKFNMRYVDLINIPNHNAGASPYVFRMNSIFDPNYTAVGHQPRFHDQVAAIYSKYCVIASKAYIEILTSGTSGDSQGAANPTVFAYLDDDPTADGRSLEQHIELGMPNSSYLMTSIPGSNTRVELSRAKRSFTMTYGVRKFWGVDKKTQLIYPAGTGEGDEYVEESRYAALFGTNPTRVCFLKLKTYDSAFDPAFLSTISARVTIDYQVVAFSPIEVGQS